jgi:hypothetical protein
MVTSNRVRVKADFRDEKATILYHDPQWMRDTQWDRTPFIVAHVRGENLRKRKAEAVKLVNRWIRDPRTTLRNVETLRDIYGYPKLVVPGSKILGNPRIVATTDPNAIPTKLTAAKVRRLPGGKVQVLLPLPKRARNRALYHGPGRGRKLSVPDQHALKIARDTLRMSDAMVGVMGGPDKKEARETVYRLTGRKPKANPRISKRDAKALLEMAKAGLVKIHKTLRPVFAQAAKGKGRKRPTR